MEEEFRRVSRDKELEVGFRSVTNGNFVRGEREFKHEQLCHKAVLKIFFMESGSPVFYGTF